MGCIYYPISIRTPTLKGGNSPPLFQFHDSLFRHFFVDVAVAVEVESRGRDFDGPGFLVPILLLYVQVRFGTVIQPSSSIESYVNLAFSGNFVYLSGKLIYNICHSISQGSRADQKHQAHGYRLQSISWPSVC